MLLLLSYRKIKHFLTFLTLKWIKISTFMLSRFYFRFALLMLSLSIIMISIIEVILFLSKNSLLTILPFVVLVINLFVASSFQTKAYSTGQL